MATFRVSMNLVNVERFIRLRLGSTHLGEGSWARSLAKNGVPGVEPVSPLDSISSLQPPWEDVNDWFPSWPIRKLVCDDISTSNTSVKDAALEAIFTSCNLWLVGYKVRYFVQRIAVR